MHKNLKTIIGRILEIIAEIESYEFYRDSLIKTTDRLYREYQEGKYSYDDYKKLLQSVLKKKSRKEWIGYYNSYIYSLLKEIEPLLSQIVYTISQDQSAEHLAVDIKEIKAKEKAKEAEEAKFKHEEAQPEYEFVEVERPSIISKLKEAIKPEEVPEEIKEIRKAEREQIKRIKAGRRIASEDEIEKRKGMLSNLISSLQKEKARIEEKKEAAPGKKRPSLLEGISYYFLKRSIERRKKIIEKKLAESRKPSMLSRIYYSFIERPVKAEKAVPVKLHKPVRHSIFSRLSRIPLFFKLMKVEKEGRRRHAKEGFYALAERKKSKVYLYLRKGMQGLPSVQLKLRNFFSQTLQKKPAAKPAAKPAEESYATAAPPAPAAPKKSRLLETLKTLKDVVRPEEKKEMEIVLKPGEDRALKKLIEHVDKINREISTLSASEESEPLSVKLKLAAIRVHFFTRTFAERISEARKQRLPKPKHAPELLKEEKEIKITVPKPAAKPYLGRISSFAVNSATRAYSSASAALKNTYSSIARIAGRALPAEAEGAKVPVKIVLPKPETKPAPAIMEKPKIRLSTSIIAPIKAWYSRLAEEEKRFVSKKTTIPHSMQVEALKKKIIPVFEEEKITPTILTEEVSRIKGIMEGGKRFKIYQPSYFGSFANTLVKRFTFTLIDNFPSIFKRLYDSLRLANIKVLSNTYVNIMVLSIMLSFAAASVLFSFFFLLVRNPFLIAVPKAMIMGIIVSLVIFILFYMYPSIRAKTRERNINTNLPFAINHIAAVAGSGVPPTKMFKLLVESDEYGEVAVELGKIVEYVDLFGYDLLTAIRSISLTVPSSTLKEFLEGIVSTIESGSELKDYLKEKSSEAMLSYELERQQYLETISTYSDVYTGILIAAPLFFMVALSLVSMLGGRIAGMDINLLIVLGAYVVIPIMNILFMMFIELTQPEV